MNDTRCAIERHPVCHWTTHKKRPAPHALSRAGLEHPLIAAKVASGEWAVVAPVEPPVLKLDYAALMNAIKAV